MRKQAATTIAQVPGVWLASFKIHFNYSSAALLGTQNPHVPIVHSGFCVPRALHLNNSNEFLALL